MFHNLIMRGITKEELLHGNIIKGLLKLATPLMFLNLINTIYSIVDTYFVGQIGELQVGAISLVTPIMNCGVAFSGGLCAAGIAMISRSIGANDKDKANNIATHLILLCLVLGIGIGVICLCFANDILKWLDTPLDIYQDTYGYFIGISFDYLFLFILSVFQCIRQSNGDSKTGVKLNSISAILNVILDPIFIFGLNLGTLGAALATVLSKAIMTPIAIKILLTDFEYTTISFKKYKPNLALLYKIIKVAVPASLGQFLSSFGFVMMSKNIVAYGSIAMSAYGIGTKISSIFYIPVNGVGGALSTFIGQSLGANENKRAHDCFKEAMKVMSLIAVVVTIVGISLAKYIILIFIKNASDLLLAMALEYAIYSILTSFCMGWFQNLSGVFDGSGNTSITMVLSIMRLWAIRIPMIYLFGKYTNLGPTGIWLSMVLSNAMICIIGQVIYFVYPWDRKGAKI